MKTLVFAGIGALILAALPVAAEQKKIGWLEPVQRDIHGWTVSIDPQLLEGEHKETGDKALSMLANHLERIAILIPADRLAKLRSIGIWIECHHPELASMQYHPEAAWLAEHGYDPKLAKKVHIPRAEVLFSPQQMLKHPAVILHELAHGYHDQILGFEDTGIIAAYKTAMAAGKYDKALLYTGETVKHYATTDEKEYFAESTETYFYHNDFYPFVRAELKIHDPQMHAEMERVWGKLN